MAKVAGFYGLIWCVLQMGCCWADCFTDPSPQLVRMTFRTLAAAGTTAAA